MIWLRRIQLPLLRAGTLFAVLMLFCPQLQAQEKPSAREKQPAKVIPPDLLTEDSPALAEKESVQNMPHIMRERERKQYRPGSRYIEHPNAEKGLIRIDKDRVYHYKVEGSKRNSVTSLKVGTYEPTELESPDGSKSFDDIYDETSFPILLYDYERVWLKKLGELNWKLGAGFYFAQGNGVFENSNPDPNPPQEKFSLFVFPLNAGLIYKLKIWEYQWIVPYAEGGFDAFLFAEHRDDDNNPPLGAALGFSPAAHFSFGGSVPLGRDSGSFLELDREYGINAISFTAEFRNYISLSDKYDFSGSVISAGISAEY